VAVPPDPQRVERAGAGHRFERGVGAAGGHDGGAGEEGPVVLRDVRQARSGVFGAGSRGAVARDPGARAAVAGGAGGGGEDRSGVVRVSGFPAAGFPHRRGVRRGRAEGGAALGRAPGAPGGEQGGGVAGGGDRDRHRCGAGGGGARCGGSGGGGGGSRDPELRADEAGRPAGCRVEEREHDGGTGGLVVRVVERGAGWRAVAGHAYGSEMRRMDGSRVHVTSEIGPLRAVICHTPGPEVLAVTPATREDFLYDDIIDLEQARREHHRFKAILSRFCEVYEVRDLLEEIVDEPEVRKFLIGRVMDVAQSEPLARELEKLPASELVALFIEGREVEEGPLQKILNVATYELPPLPNLFFARDAAMVVGDGVVIGSMRYTVRWTEEILMKALFTYHPKLQRKTLIYDGSEERRAGYTLEGGDLHVLRPDLVMMGLSERSSPGAFDTIADRLVKQVGIKDILLVVLPNDRAMIHLDMIFTMVDRDHCVIFPPAFVGPTRCSVLHYHAGRK